MKKIQSLPRTQIPVQAQVEIQAILQKEKRISTAQVDAILLKHKVKGKPQALQRAYRLQMGQRYLASLRDTKGKREVLAARGRPGMGMDYIMVDSCNDVIQLTCIRRKLHSGISGLQRTADKVGKRVKYLNHVQGWNPAARQARGFNAPDLLETYFFPQGGRFPYDT